MVVRQTLAPLRLSRWQIFKLMTKILIFSSKTRAFTFFTLLSLIGYIVFRMIWGQREKYPDHGLPIVKRDDYHFDDIITEGKRLVKTGFTIGIREAKRC